MTILHSLILGIVEGFTEFLPISSTAHLTLTSQLMGLDQSAFVKTFEIAIQSGAIFAVLAIYWRKFLDFKILKQVVIAFIPTGIIGLILYKIAKQYLLGNVSVVLWSLAIGGVIIILFEKYWAKKARDSRVNSAQSVEGSVVEGVEIDGSVEVVASTEIVSDEIKGLNIKQTALVGVFQSLAIIPGVSRSAATIIGGRLLGISKEAIVEFSFLLAVPTILAATALDLLKNYKEFSMDQFGNISIGFIASFITALIGIKFLMSYIRKNDFTSFGLYRIVVAVIFAIFIYFKIIG